MKLAEEKFDFFIQGGRKEVLLFAHQLKGNIHPFSLITLRKTWHLLFWSKIRMQKILKIAQKFNFLPIFVNWHHKGPLLAYLTAQSPQNVPIGPHDSVNH